MVAALAAATLAGCRDDTRAPLRVSAAVSLTESLTAAVKQWERETGEAATLNFAASNVLSRQIEEARQPEYFGRDHKSRLQERLQSLGRPLPSYRIASEIGPDHRKLFYVEVIVGAEVLAQGAGRTKKEAEQEGARLALSEITKVE